MPAKIRVVTRHRLEIRPDFVERIRASPTKALAEVIGNSLDADATKVEVVSDRSQLDAIDAVEVRDNGTGMTHEQAIVAFGLLGGSWKDIEKQTGKRRRWLCLIEAQYDQALTPIDRRVGVLDATVEETAWLVEVGERGGPVFDLTPFDRPTTMSRWYEEHPDFPRDP